MTSKHTTSIRLMVWGVAGLALLTSTVQIAAMFMRPETENVPIDRVVQNLSRRAAADPRDVLTRLNLARVNAMAWATKAATTPTVVKQFGTTPPGDPYFWEFPGFQHVTVQSAPSANALADAKAHLEQAVAGYEAVLAIDPTNVIARLGDAWCLDQAGDQARAIEGYRRVIDAVWPNENAGQVPLMNFKPTTTEVAGYLIPLLDPEKNAAEIATLKERASHAASLQRSITPIAIPLGHSDRPFDLSDPRARVLFDADGSGLKRQWTWITPDAGWLVFDRHGRGDVTSALQWFGSVTFWLFWDNGYQALDALDDNHDGVIAGDELEGLAVWRDRNGDGVSQPGEVVPVAAVGIVRLSCRYERPVDDPTVAAWSEDGVTFRNGVTRPTYDLVLRRR